MRGARYAFANRSRLEKRLGEIGIRYLHFPNLAPPAEVREVQKHVDREGRIAKRERAELAPEFVAAYRRACLSDFCAEEFLERIGSAARAIALFCVEREPKACHRSLVADRLERDLGVDVKHLMP